MNGFIVMYHGGILPGRGIETLIKLVKINENIFGVILGNGQDDYIRNLKNMADELHTTNRLKFYKAVRIEELWKYVGAADVGMILAPAAVKNMLFSLPNKFFENIKSGTPVICPFYPEMERIVKTYQVGLTCDPENIDDINNCVERLRTDKEFYAYIKNNVKKAQDEFCWENEKRVLINEYRNLIG